MYLGPKLLLLVSFCALAQAWKTYNGYMLVEVEPTSPLQRDILHQLVRHAIIDVGSSLRRVGKTEFMVSPLYAHQVLRALEAAEIHYEIKEEDLGRIVAEEKARLLESLKNREGSFDVNDWNRLEDVNDHLKVWASSCATGVSCSVYSAGKSYEGRDLNVFKIGKDDGGTRQAIWLDATIHSREWISLGTILKLIDHFVTQYDTDSDVKYLVDTYDWYFLPIVNPDGYVWSWDEDRYWRKNRKPDSVSPHCIGVDLNRNYDVNWGKEGVDTFPCGTAFCGRAPNSEPETKVVVNELHKIAETQLVRAFITYHGYGRMWMFPWGHTEGFNGWKCVRTENHDDQMAVADDTANAIQKTHNTRWSRGTSCEVIYATTGGSDDWARHSVGVQYAFNPELRGRDFIIDKSEIPYSFSENWNGLKAMVAKIEEIEAKKRA